MTHTATGVSKLRAVVTARFPRLFRVSAEKETSEPSALDIYLYSTPLVLLDPLRRAFNRRFYAFCSSLAISYKE